MTQPTPTVGDLVETYRTTLPHSSTIDVDDPDALDEWFSDCADALMPHFEATEDHRGWMTDADLKLAVKLDTNEWYEPVTEHRTVTDSHVTATGIETTEHTEEVTVDRVLKGNVVGSYLDVQADTETEQQAVAALAHALDLTVDEYSGTHTRFTHRLSHPEYTPHA